MRHLWQWLCGYVCICIKGRQVNRFLNLCSRNGIRLWRIRMSIEQEIYANLRYKDFYDLKPYLRKTKSRLKIVAKKGFPFWCHRHPKFKWFFCICLCVLCIIMYSMNYVWHIQINGNYNISSQEIFAYLEDNNVSVGQKKQGIDCSGIEIMLREHFEQIGWVSVYFQKTNLCIEVKESLYDVLDNSDFEIGKQYDFVANKDAKIVSIITRRGKALVDKNQFVKKGDILVLGLNEIYDDAGQIKDILYFKADALIYADVCYKFEIPLSELEIVSLKISDCFSEERLLQIGYNKSRQIVENMEKRGIVVLDKYVEIKNNEKDIRFWLTIYTRENIGINLPVEEVFQNEFK